MSHAAWIIEVISPPATPIPMLQTAVTTAAMPVAGVLAVFHRVTCCGCPLLGDIVDIHQFHSQNCDDIQLLVLSGFQVDSIPTCRGPMPMDDNSLDVNVGQLFRAYQFSGLRMLTVPNLEFSIFFQSQDCGGNFWDFQLNNVELHVLSCALS